VNGFTPPRTFVQLLPYVVRRIHSGMNAGLTTTLYCSACLLLLAGLEARAAAPALRPFDATYEARYKGIRGGTMLVLRSEGIDDPSLRINRYWHAPGLAFLPIAVERSRKGKVDVSLRLLELKYLD
jgi:hypothetical protein